MKSGIRERLNKISKSELFHLKNKRGNRTIYITLLLFILCVIIMYCAKERIVKDFLVPVTPSHKNIFYGRVLFENGHPAIIRPQLWERSSSYVTIEPPIPNNPYHTYSAISEKEGIFSLYLSDELLGILNQGEHNITISCPCYDDDGGRLYKQVGIFPVNLLKNNISKAKEIRVKRPKDINDCPITYASEWIWLDQYQNEIMKLHKESFIANSERIAEKLDWGPAHNGIRCKLSCANQNMQTADPQFLLLYVQNVSQNDITIRNNIGKVMDIALNGRITGKRNIGSGAITGRNPEYITIKPGEIVKVPYPIGALDYMVPFDDVGSHALSTSWPGTYNVQVIYSFGNSPNREENKITSNELVITVKPRDKVGYEGEFILGESLPVILYHGTENNQYLVKGHNITFEKINDNIMATLKISFNTIHDFNWQTELEILDDTGTVISKFQRIDDNKGKARIIDRDFQFSLGAWSKISSAKTFRLSFIPVLFK
jgi:hypothetical protein